MLTAMKPHRSLSAGRLLMTAVCVAGWLTLPVVAQQKTNSNRWERDIAAYEAVDKTNPPPKGAIVFVGSSSIRKWQTLAEDFAGIAVIGRGFGGSQLGDSVRYAARIVLPYEPKMVVLYAGDNDLAAGKLPEQVFADFKAFVAKIHAKLPQTRIGYVSIKPSTKRWALIEKIKQVNHLVKEFTQSDSRLVFLDIFTPMLGPDSKPRLELLAADGLHLTREGYKLWASVIRPRLN